MSREQAQPQDYEEEDIEMFDEGDDEEGYEAEEDDDPYVPTELLVAVERGDPQEISDLLAAKAMVDEYGRGGKCYHPTPLELAVDKGNITIVEQLLKAKANPDGRGMLDYPVKQALRNPDLLKLLLAYKAHVAFSDSDSRENPLQAAARFGCVSAIPILLAADASLLDKAGPYTPTPLHTASAKGFTEVVAQLLLAKADAHRRAEDSSKNYPIHSAASGPHSQVIKQLLDAKADVHSRDARGNTPLHCGATTCVLGADPHHSTPQTITTLLEAKARVNAINRAKMTPLHESVAFLVRRQALSFMPYSYAAFQQSVEILLAHKADPLLRDAQGLRAIDYIKELREQYPTCLQVLQDATVNKEHSNKKCGLALAASLAPQAGAKSVIAEVGRRNSHFDRHVLGPVAFFSGLSSRKPSGWKVLEKEDEVQSVRTVVLSLRKTPQAGS